ncbi:MAG: TetR/AcrR family transcriptional regulator [bacterium]
MTAKDKLLSASLAVIRTKGYAATTVDDLCAAAGVTKGAFFHHFKSKEDLGVAAAQYWGEHTGGLFAGAEYHRPADPLDRILAYLDFRESLLSAEVPAFTCLAGTMLQEVYATTPTIREAAFLSITDHAQTLEHDYDQAIALYGRPDCPNAQSLALHTQTVLQGAFVLAKGYGGPEVVRESIAHLRRYLMLLLVRPN